jgi:hypothetical protein
MNDLPSYDAHQIMEEVRRKKGEDPRINIYRLDETPLSQIELVILNSSFNKAYQEIRSQVPEVQGRLMENVNGFFWELEGVYTWNPTVYYLSDEGDQLLVNTIGYNKITVQNPDDEVTEFTTSNTLRKPLSQSTTTVMENIERLAWYSMNSDNLYGVYIIGERGEEHGILRPMSYVHGRPTQER